MNRFDVTGKTAVVTGAGRGIGKALALGLAEAGAKVACVARTETDIREVVCQAAGRIMCEQRYGRIVNIASVAGLVALRTGVAYGASKSGVIHMTRVLALEWSKYGVNINAIAPWYFRTPLTEKLLDDPAFLQEVLSRTPSGRIGNAEDLVGPAIFLASDAAAYISGQTIAVDGGMSVYGF